MKSRNDTAMILAEYFDPEKMQDAGLRLYLEEHIDTYFGNGFFDDLEQHIGWQIDDILCRCEEDMRYDKAHRNDTVRLDQRRRMMLFNDHAVPAYWYEENMDSSEIESQLRAYRMLWKDLDFTEITYPCLETWCPLEEWNRKYSTEMLEKMERDLERHDNEEAEVLYRLYIRHSDVSSIHEYYPFRIREILSIDHRIEDEKENSADIRLKLYDGSVIAVNVHRDRNGWSHGMTALDPEGFPYMTERDEKLIAEEVFGIHGRKQHLFGL
ncbi:MAG: hypothetical protein IJ130_14405 [Solobacterium sp.]|nr:hypothetical protein [Solobacterium sp.]